ncbi:MAG: hypothetical protein PHU68_03685, partial [Paludibacter sp.]|nr:hypothetical protein [Paludibacter sp.]
TTLGLSDEELEERKANVLAKDCLCVGLSNAASLHHDELFLKNNKAVNICPGPNIVNYTNIVSLPTMIDHIYGRTELVTNKQRPHVFIAEMAIYLRFLKKELVDGKGDTQDRKRKNYYELFLHNLSEARNYYQSLYDAAVITKAGFAEALQQFGEEISGIRKAYSLG